MAPSIVESAGAAEQWSKDAPMLARMYESAQSGQTQASIASAHNATQMNAAQLAESGRDSTSANMLQEHARQFDESRLPSQADAFHAQAAMAQQQQRAELGAWLNQQDLSQAEGMRLQRLQGAVGHVMADESLDPETKQNLLMQLKTGIDPLRQRVEMQKANLEKEQTEKLHNAVAAQYKFSQMNAQDQAKYLQGQTRTVKFDDGTTENFLVGLDGSVTHVKKEKAAVEADQASMAFSTWTKYEEHATNMAMKQQEAEMKAWEAKVKEATANEKEVPVFSAPDVQSRIAANMKRLTGYSSYSDMLKGQQGKWKNHGQVTDQPDPDQTTPNPQGGLGQAPPQPGPTQTPTTPEPFKRFDLGDPKSMSPTQKQWVDDLDVAKDAISPQNRPDLEPKQRKDALEAADTMKRLLAKYGNKLVMKAKSREDWAYYQRAEAELAAIPKDPNAPYYQPGSAKEVPDNPYPF